MPQLLELTPVLLGIMKKDKMSERLLGVVKEGFTTKIHAVVDDLGQVKIHFNNPVNTHNITQASQLLEGFKNANVIGDKAYDSNALIEQINKQSCTPIIPSRSNHKNTHDYDEHLYKQRHLIECFFNKIKHFRIVLASFDKKDSSFAGFLAYASFIICLR